MRIVLGQCLLLTAVTVSGAHDGAEAKEKQAFADSEDHVIFEGIAVDEMETWDNQNNRHLQNWQCASIQGEWTCTSVSCGSECACERRIGGEWGVKCDDCVVCNNGDIGYDCSNYRRGMIKACDGAGGSVTETTKPTTPAASPTTTTSSSIGQSGMRSGCGTVDSSSFHICVDALKTGKYTKDWTLSAAAAKRRWERVIIGNLPSVDLKKVRGYPQRKICNTLPITVDDVYICFKDPFIDGRGRVLGQAGPVLTRTDNYLPVTGFMEFDSDDIQLMINNGMIEDVIAHEMGHVIGPGSAWRRRGLVYNQGTDSSPDYVYRSGTKACQMWRETTGCPGCPPIENDGGRGTRGGHWDEAVMGNELMSGFAERPGVSMPISKITVASLEDLGYRVNYSAAEPYPTAPNCGRRFLRKKNGGKGGKKLSKVGEAQAIEYGKMVLAKAKKEKPKKLPAGLAYAADQFVNVLFMEHDTVYAVGVTPDE